MIEKNVKLELDVLALREQWRKMPTYDCWWSSPDNEKGLQLTPTIEPGRLSVEMEIKQHHSGFPGIAHGGIAFTILDGLMGWYVMSHKGRAGFTTTSAVKYKGPLLVGKKYTFVVTDNSNDNQAPGTLSLLGQALDMTQPEGSRRPLVEMTADFFQPNRSTAKKILGIEFDENTNRLFPE